MNSVEQNIPSRFIGSPDEIQYVDYSIPNNLSTFQEHMYKHLIDWKRKNITTNCGVYTAD